MMRTLLFFTVAFLGPNALVAQPLLTPEEAVHLALNQNLSVRLTQADAAIAHRNNTAAYAGLLPIVNLAVNETFTLSAFQQRLINGNEFNALGAPFNNINGAVQASWVVYEGGRARFAKERLQALDEQARLSLQAVVQQTTAQVLMTYYEVVRNRLQERATEELIALNEARLRIAEARVAAGVAAQPDVLQARLDLNQLRANLLQQQAATAASKATLNQLLARPPQTPFEVVPQMEVVYLPDRERLRARAQAENPLILALQKSAEAAARAVEEANALRGPRITANGQFVAVRTDNGAGFIRNNNQAGFAIGASLALPLYNGGNLKRQAEVARISAEQAALSIENQRLALEAAIENQLALFRAQQQTLALEEENLLLARESVLISTERFRLGQTTALEVQAAQGALEQALLRQNLARFNLKMSEVQLRFLAADF